MNDGWIPRQHGGWPMAIVPLLIGVILSGPTFWQALLFLAWILAFLFFNAFGLWIKSRRRRFTRPTIVYGSLAACSALVLVGCKPQLIFWGLPMGVLFLWALGEILRRNDRSLGARISAIIASSLMAPIAYSLGSTQDNWQHLWISTVILALYFIGSVPYVKTLIRNRGNQKWLIGSITFHFIVFLGACISALLGYVSWIIPVVWLILLIRSYAYPKWSEQKSRRLTPRTIGLSEFVYCAIVCLGILIN